MLRFLSLVIISSLLFSCSSYNYTEAPIQTQTKYKNKYKAFLEPNSILKQYGYNYTIEEIPSLGIEVRKVYNPDKMILNQRTTIDVKTQLLDGAYASILDDGSIHEAGFMKKGKRHGVWEIRNQKGEFKNELRHGTWSGYDSLGRLEYTLEYDQGEMILGSNVFYDSLGNVVNNENMDKVNIFKLVEEMPRYPGCENMEGTTKEKKSCADRKMLEYIYGNISYPEKARELSVSGMALFQFVVEKNGDISEIKTLRGVCKEIEEECLGIIKNMPKWIPGKQRGNPVRVQFTLPVKFKLE